MSVFELFFEGFSSECTNARQLWRLFYQNKTKHMSVFDMFLKVSALNIQMPGNYGGFSKYN